MPFRWPNTCQDVMLTTEVAQRRPRCPADYEEIARVLSPIFLEDKKPVVLSWRACRERMNGLISKYLEEDKKALKRSGTEEEYSELIQLLEDINTFRKDMEDEAKKAYETKRRKEKDDREKGEEMREAALIGMAKRENATSSSSSENSSSDESSKENEASAITSKPAKGQKNKKRASKLTALEMLEEINKQKAVLKEKELEQRRLELEFQKRKYEDEAKERKERLDQELEERRLLFALLKDKF
ncbi:stress response protein NST1-like [Stylophora pistillata]|uniref:stress response protein NST1-like n=1 Tax=Stylophora pistillata TaxID=50429 RepID=UPI000C03FC58|nr:stress response protein NST1-like [Stylophora pistillata]